MNDIPNTQDSVEEEPSAEATEYANRSLLHRMIDAGYLDEDIEHLAAGIPDQHPNKYILIDQYLEYYIQKYPDADIEAVKARLVFNPAK